MRPGRWAVDLETLTHPLATNSHSAGPVRTSHSEHLGSHFDLRTDHCHRLVRCSLAVAVLAQEVISQALDWQLHLACLVQVQETDRSY